VGASKCACTVRLKKIGPERFASYCSFKIPGLSSPQPSGSCCWPWGATPLPASNLSLPLHCWSYHRAWNSLPSRFSNHLGTSELDPVSKKHLSPICVPIGHLQLNLHDILRIYCGTTHPSNEQQRPFTQEEHLPPQRQRRYFSLKRSLPIWP
jgi:hypothetical protein